MKISFAEGDRYYELVVHRDFPGSGLCGDGGSARAAEGGCGRSAGRSDDEVGGQLQEIDGFLWALQESCWTFGYWGARIRPSNLIRQKEQRRSKETLVPLLFFAMQKK